MAFVISPWIRSEDSILLTASRQKIGKLDCVLAMHEQSAPDLQESGPEAVVILCHGYGASGTDLVPCSAELLSGCPDLERVLFVFPAAPIQMEGMGDARAWWPLDMVKLQEMIMSGQTRDLRGETPPELADRREMITELIDSIRGSFELSAEQIVLGGFSQGAMLTTDVALHYPDPLGGLIIWSGSLVSEEEWSRQADRQSGLRIYQSHGKTDPILPFTGAELLRELLVSHGHQVEFELFAGEHTIPAHSIDGARKLISAVVKDCRQTEEG